MNIKVNQMDQMMDAFERKYVYIHGFINLRHMLGSFIADFVETDPRAFEGFHIEDLTMEFMEKYHIPTGNDMLVDDIRAALDDEAWNY